MNPHLRKAVAHGLRVAALHITVRLNLVANRLDPPVTVTFDWLNDDALDQHRRRAARLSRLN